MFKQLKAIINDYYDQGDIVYIKTIDQSLDSVQMTIRYELVIHCVAVFFGMVALGVSIWARSKGLHPDFIDIDLLILICALFLGLCVGVLLETAISLIYYIKIEEYCEDKTKRYDELSQV